MAIISSGATASSEITRRPEQGGLVIEFPAAMTGTKLDIYGSIDGGANFRQIYSEGVALSVNKVNSTIHVIAPSKIHGISRFKVVSDTAEAADRDIRVSVGDVI